MVCDVEILKYLSFGNILCEMAIPLLNIGVRNVIQIMEFAV